VSAFKGAGRLVYFYATRLIACTGIGGEYSAVNSAIDEMMPARYRGRTDIWINGSCWLGFCLVTNNAVPVYGLAFAVGNLAGPLTPVPPSGRTSRMPRLLVYLTACGAAALRLALQLMSGHRLFW
jgi:hypothetical protein